MPLVHAWGLAEDEPVATAPVIEDARAAATASGVRSLRAMASLAEAELACSTGDLPTAIEVAMDDLQGPWTTPWGDHIRLASFAALLLEDEDALRSLIDVAERGLRNLARHGAMGQPRAASARAAPPSTECRE